MTDSAGCRNPHLAFDKCLGTRGEGRERCCKGEVLLYQHHTPPHLHNLFPKLSTLEIEILYFIKTCIF